MTLTKIVNGERVEMAAEEEKEFLAEGKRHAIDWYRLIDARANESLNGGITVTANGTDYRVNSGPSARSLIAGAKVRAQEAINAGETLTRKIPTDKGIVSANEQQLVALFDIMDTHHQAVMDRVEELHGKVADGTITDDDLTTGWPT